MASWSWISLRNSSRSAGSPSRSLLSCSRSSGERSPSRYPATSFWNSTRLSSTSGPFELRLHASAEGTADAHQGHLHGVGRNADLLRDRLAAQAHAVVEADDLAGAVLQVFHAPSQGLEPLVVEAAFLFCGNRKLLQVFRQTIPFHTRAEGQPFPLLAGDVPDDPLHPESEVAGRVELFQVFECGHKGLLGDVFGHVRARRYLGRV